MVDKREVQESETDVGWAREETRPRLRRKKDTGYETTRERKLEDRSRDGWTLSTETRELSGQQNMNYMT